MTLQAAQGLAAALGPDGWLDCWSSLHESAHAVTARHFGLKILFADVQRVRIEHRFYQSADCKNSKERLIVSAAGDVATTIFLNFTDTGTSDYSNSMSRLRDLGATPEIANRLMSDAKRDAGVLVKRLKDDIVAVAEALRKKRGLTETEIDEVMEYHVLPNHR